MTARGQRAEPADVELGVVDPDQVARWPRLDQIGAGPAQRRAQALNGTVERTPHAGRRRAFPQHLGESVQADHSPGFQQQRREQHPLPWCGHGHVSRAVPDY